MSSKIQQMKSKFNKIKSSQILETLVTVWYKLIPIRVWTINSPRRRILGIHFKEKLLDKILSWYQDIVLEDIWETLTISTHTNNILIEIEL